MFIFWTSDFGLQTIAELLSVAVLQFLLYLKILIVLNI